MILNIKLLPDGSGRVCIHWLMEDAAGPIETKGEVRMTKLGLMKLGGVRGRIACNPEQNSVNPQDVGGERLMCMHTNDVRAATCPKCLATSEAKAMMERYDGEIAEATPTRESLETLSQIANVAVG